MAKASDLGVDNVYAVCTELFNIKGDVHKQELKFLCPVHADNKPSAGVNLQTGYWNCWSCKGGGDLVDLGAAILGKKKRDIKKLLRPNEPTAIVASIQSRVKGRRRAENVRQVGREVFMPVLPSPDDYRDGPMRYMFDRGFSKNTIKRWNVRYVKKDRLVREDDTFFDIDHAIAIPIYSERGKLVAWCYRATPDSAGWFRNARYVYTPGATSLNKTWFGLHLAQNISEIVVTEGAMDAMWCDQNGIPAVAILGSHAKQDEKIRKLQQFKKVVVLPDRDRAGEDSALALGEALRARGVPVNVCRYPSFTTGTDAQELGKADLELMVARAIPFPLWKRGLEGVVQPTT